MSPAAFPTVAKSVVVVRLTGAVVPALPDAEGATDVVVEGIVVTSVDEVDSELTDVVDGTDGVVVLGGSVVAGLEVVTGAAEVVVLAGAGEVVVGAAEVVTAAASGTSASAVEAVVDAGAVVVLSWLLTLAGPSGARPLLPPPAPAWLTEGERSAPMTGVAPGSWPVLSRRAFSSAACTASCCLWTSATANARSPFTPARVTRSEDCWVAAAARSAESWRVAALTDARCSDNSENRAVSLTRAWP